MCRSFFFFLSFFLSSSLLALSNLIWTHKQVGGAATINKTNNTVRVSQERLETSQVWYMDVWDIIIHHPLRSLLLSMKFTMMVAIILNFH